MEKEIITLHRIREPGDALLERLVPLYEEAFPPAERRDAGQLARVILARERMHFLAVLEGTGDETGNGGDLADPVGLLVYWDFREFYYLEHVAVRASCRGRSIGTRVLETVARQLPGTRLLEIEPPSDETRARRVAWYERNGYRVLDKAYTQPPYDGRGPGCPLWIMGNERPAHLPAFLERVKREVYNENV
ncbi:MAG: GNAT family N-acetyltransferase [Odoribacteraceae bacterium]|jgi:ribosomal protein S18 acetylase RimI-like enzyme|nr:GNAT family N-acetyltransferase [Odoribacteraceae bacterium]